MLSKSFESISFCKSLMKFALFVASEVVHTPRGFKMASRLVQDGRLEPIWTQHGTELAASWLKLGPSQDQVGSNLAQVGPMLDPFPGLQPPLGQPKPFQTPSLWPLGLPKPKLCPTRLNIPCGLVQPCLPTLLADLAALFTL